MRAKKGLEGKLSTVVGDNGCSCLLHEFVGSIKDVLVLLHV